LGATKQMCGRDRARPAPRGPCRRSSSGWGHAPSWRLPSVTGRTVLALGI
jgi:hypothetical protein